MNPGIPQASGFSLIEVLCAILILGVALAGLTQGITTALSSSKESEVQTAAALLAAGVIETLRAEGGLQEGETEGEGPQGLSQYRWKESIHPARIDGLYEVAVTVENARSGRLIYELKTLLFEPPLTSLPDESSRRRETRTERKRGTR